MFTLKKHRITAPTSSAITSINDLHDDLVVEVICRLPPKHMISCKSVSKLWHRLISTVCIPQLTSTPVHGLLFNISFIPPYTTKKKGTWSFVCLNSSHDPSLVESCLGNSLPFRPSYDLLDCSNGLLLFFDPSSLQYIVCNPSTQQYTAIPNSPRNNIPVTAALIFNPDCKVVHISGRPLATMNIFSLATRKWSVYNLDVELSILESPVSPRYIFLHTSLYRLSMTGCLVKFGVEQVGFQRIELPIFVEKGGHVGCLGVSQDCLHYGWDDGSSEMKVWMLLERGHTSEWVLKHTLCFQYFFKQPVYCNPEDDEDPSWFTFLAFHPTSEILYVGDTLGIYSYDPDTKRVENICTVGEDQAMFCCQYLVFPCSINLTPLEAFSQSLIRESPGSCYYVLGWEWVFNEHGWEWDFTEHGWEWVFNEH